jgi:hypothetical protein
MIASLLYKIWQFCIMIGMSRQTIRNTILFGIFLSLMVISAVGVSYALSGVAYEQQRSDVIRAATYRANELEHTNATVGGVPSMVVPPSQ